MLELKLILNHQESHTLENHNMFKFRALLGETCLHKKGKQHGSVCLRVLSQHRKLEQNK
jgi:hypothetical protein